MTGVTFSAEIDKLAPALVELLGALETLPKNRHAKITGARGSYEYDYTDLASALELTRPKMLEHRVCAVQLTFGGPETVTVQTLLLHESGQWLLIDPLSLSAGGTPQAAGSAITYARRYQFAPALSLASEEDDDGQTAARESGEAKQPPPRQSAATTSRTPEEAEIRSILAGLPSTEVREIQESFKSQFGSTLVALAPEHHPKALEYVKWSVQSHDQEPEPKANDDGSGYG